MSRGFMAVSWRFHGRFHTLGLFCQPQEFFLLFSLLFSNFLCGCFKFLYFSLLFFNFLYFSLMFFIFNYFSLILFTFSLLETHVSRFHGGFIAVSWPVSYFGLVLSATGVTSLILFIVLFFIVFLYILFLCCFIIL